MPVYEYQCPKCLVVTDVVKGLQSLDEAELCPGEGCPEQKMERIISSAPQINTSNCQFQSHYNPAFGKIIHSKRQIQDEVRKYKYEQGREIVEIGNDTLKSVKKQRKEYTLE